MTPLFWADVVHLPMIYSFSFHCTSNIVTQCTIAELNNRIKHTVTIFYLEQEERGERQRREVSYQTPGSNAVLSYEMDGVASDTVRWSFGGADIERNESARRRTTDDGHLIIESVRYADQGAYTWTTTDGGAAVQFIIRVHGVCKAVSLARQNHFLLVRILLSVAY